MDALEAKGIETGIGNAYRDIQKRNAELAELKQELAEIDWSLEHEARREIDWQDRLEAAAIDKARQQDELSKLPKVEDAREIKERQPPAQEQKNEWIKFIDLLPKVDEEPSLSTNKAPAPEKKKDEWKGFNSLLELRADKDMAQGAERRIIVADARARSETGDLSPKAKQFREELEKYDIDFAAVTLEEANRSHREAEFAKALGNYAPRFKEGEIVAVTARGPEYRVDGQTMQPRMVHKLDQDRAEVYLQFLKTDKCELQGIDATRQKVDGKAAEKEKGREDARFDRATEKNKASGREIKPLRTPGLRDVPRLIQRIALGIFGFVLELLAPTAKPVHQEQEQAQEDRELIDFQEWVKQAEQEREKAQEHHLHEHRHERERERHRDR